MFLVISFFCNGYHSKPQHQKVLLGLTGYRSDLDKVSHRGDDLLTRFEQTKCPKTSPLAKTCLKAQAVLHNDLKLKGHMSVNQTTNSLS